ncbi:hypothetical protein BgiBS90_020763 [Biomphalaria glabrata]|nr:hypothetical protein BgiBS90_020763 [Biomphalaria glabrata]
MPNTKERLPDNSTFDSDSDTLAMFFSGQTWRPADFSTPQHPPPPFQGPQKVSTLLKTQFVRTAMTYEVVYANESIMRD